MKVIVRKPYLRYEVGQQIDVRPQDARLLIPRGVVSAVEFDDVEGPKPMKPMKPMKP